jgi:hypothetical protein
MPAVKQEEIIRNTLRVVKTTSYQKALEKEIIYDEDRKELFN